MGGRPIAGGGQITLAIVGCVVMMIWFFQTMKAYYATAVGDEATPGNVKLLIVGASVFGVSWLWSLVTSISLLREVSVEPPPTPPAVPPRITN
jgi:hypothetical protein